MVADSLNWLKLDSGPEDPAFNMAFDEALLEAMPRLGMPVLRFYGWSSPAASFGYFQKYSEVEQLTPLRPLVRRPTGGGIVPHDADWTYSVAVPPSHPWYALSAVDSYRRVHEWIRDAFHTLGLRTQLAQEPCHDQPGQCFVGYEQFDLLMRGRKIAGAAQRRRRDGLLIQGSVQATHLGVSRAAWQEAMRETVSINEGVRWSELIPDDTLQERAQTLASSTYAKPSFNQRR